MRRHLGTCLEHSRVIDSRFRPQSGHVYRWRKCLKCARRFATNEVEIDELERLRRIESLQQKLHEVALAASEIFADSTDSTD